MSQTVSVNPPMSPQGVVMLPEAAHIRPAPSALRIQPALTARQPEVRSHLHAPPRKRSVEIGSGRRLEVAASRAEGDGLLSAHFPHRPSSWAANRTRNIRSLPGDDLGQAVRYVFGSVANEANVIDCHAVCERAIRTLRDHGVDTKHELCNLLDSVQRSDLMTGYFHGLFQGMGFAIGSTMASTAPGAAMLQATRALLPDSLGPVAKAAVAFMPMAFCLSLSDVIPGNAIGTAFTSVNKADLSQSESMRAMRHGYYRLPPPSALPASLWHARQPTAARLGVEVGTGAVLGYGMARNLIRLGAAFGLARRPVQAAMADLAIDSIGGPVIASPVLRAFVNAMNDYSGRAGNAHFLGRVDLAEQLVAHQASRSHMVSATRDVSWHTLKMAYKGLMDTSLRDLVATPASVASHAVLTLGFAGIVAAMQQMEQKNWPQAARISLQFTVLLNAVYFMWGFAVGGVSAPRAKDVHRPLDRMAFPTDAGDGERTPDQPMAAPVAAPNAEPSAPTGSILSSDTPRRAPPDEPRPPGQG